MSTSVETVIEKGAPVTVARFPGICHCELVGCKFDAGETIVKLARGVWVRLNHYNPDTNTPSAPVPSDLTPDQKKTHCYICQQPLGEKKDASGNYLVRWDIRGGTGNHWHVACKPDAQSPRPFITPTPSFVTSAPNEMNGGNPFALFAQYLQPFMATKVDEETVSVMIEERIDERITNAIQAALKESVHVTRIEVSNASTGVVRTIDNAHELMPEVLDWVEEREHVYLWGEPGSGKSTLARHIADVLGWQFGYIALNPQTPDSKVLGYMNGHGNYVTTVFRQIYENGGIFCIDELDNAAPSLLVTLNGLLENGHGAFPDGNIPRHPDFVLIATGNTPGRGADKRFPERRPFDIAFGERFVFLKMGYDERMETAVVQSIAPTAVQWLEWVRNVRRYMAANDLRCVATPRASFKGAKKIAKGGTVDVPKLAEQLVFKGLDVNTVKSVLNNCPLPRY